MKLYSQKDGATSLGLARQALSLMAMRKIEPTPVNYAVWYNYAAGERKELIQELDQLLGKKETPISDDVNIYLYNKYLVPDIKKKEESLESTSKNTQNVLAEIMLMIEQFSGDTETYTQQMEEHVTEMTEKITDPTLKKMAEGIVNRAMAIRDSGAALNGKLEESRNEVMQLKTTLERVTTEASRDFLTGVSNRKALETKLDEMTAWATEQQGDLCLLMIDIDHFKTFNDKYGHLVGDEVLRKVGRVLLDGIKGKDFAARYGGEEFAVLLPSTPLGGGLAVAESLRRAVEENNLVRKDTGQSIGLVTVSIGVARYRPKTDSVAMLISRADNALYRSKMGGRNRVTQESFE